MFISGLDGEDQYPQRATDPLNRPSSIYTLDRFAIDMMKGVQKSFLFMIVVCRRATAIPYLVARQGGESLFDPFLDELGAATVGAAEAVWKLLSPEDKSPQSIPEQAPSKTSSDDSSASNPDMEYLESIAPSSLPPVKNECDHIPPNSEQDSDGINHVTWNDDPCGFATDQIIYPENCEDTTLDATAIEVQNEAIAQALIDMVGVNGVRTSRRKCGVFFWTAKVTAEQTETIRGMKGVTAVAPDGPIEIEPKSSEDTLPEEESGQLPRRDTILTRLSVTQDLAFISQPPGFKQSRGLPSYSYFSRAGKGVKVYVLDTGAVATNAYFIRHNDDDNNNQQSVVEGWLYAFDTDYTPSDSDVDGHGTCAASKVAEVVPEVGLIIVKTKPFKSSLLDGLEQILEHLELRLETPGQNVKGYTVVTIQQGWQGDDDYNKQALEGLIRRLVQEFQVVITVGSGRDSTNSQRDIDYWPALFSLTYPIITVGAVDPYSGITFDWSMGGPALTVSAPGHVRCAAAAPGNWHFYRFGTSFAAPAVAGLVAYFLSLEDVGNMLRNEKTLIPQAVKAYILKWAYIRPGGTDQAIWNGLDPDAPDKWQPF